MPRNRIRDIRIIFSHLNLIWTRRIVGGITSIVTMGTTYLENKIDCENKEIIIATSNVPIKMNIDSHKTNRYSENDFVRLLKMVKKIKP